MPGRDKTGPEGEGPMTGRRLGRCSGNDKGTEDDDSRPGRGMRGGRGGRRNFGLRGNKRGRARL